LALLAGLDTPGRPVAEVNRRLGDAADLLGVPRPSYEQVRVHIHDLRSKARIRDPVAIELELDRYAGLRVKPRPFEPEDAGLERRS
jgi:hypothetical protein